MKSKNFCITLLALIFFHFSANPAHSCVGRVLILALSNSPDQAVVGQLLATMITERTGTTIEIIKPGDEKAVQDAMTSGKAQIYIGYVGSAKANLEKGSEITNQDELYAAVRQAYLDKFKFVWLKPFGYNGPTTPGAEKNSSMAVPVTTTEVLKSFPVLDRVINKLSNKLDNKIVEELGKEAADQDLKGVVKSYLKSHNMI